MEHKKPDFSYGNLSDVGKVRTENQDYYGRYSESFGQLIIVCDGMGGYNGGAIASRLAVESIAEHFKRLGSHYDPRFELEQALVVAQKNLLEYTKTNPEVTGMGTTAVLLLIIGTNYWFANIGDSRLYLKRAGQLRQLSKDHSFVQGMIDNGILTEEQAAEHPKRNVITRALGTDKCVPDISGPYALYKSDVFMLCSDGLYHYFKLKELELLMDKEPQAACEAMVEIANSKGSDDNVTVQIVKSHIGETPEPEARDHRQTRWMIILICSILAVLSSLVVLALPLYKHVLSKPQPTTTVILKHSKPKSSVNQAAVTPVKSDSTKATKPVKEKP